MSIPKRCIAIKGATRLALLALCAGASLAYAAPVGTVTHLSGPLLNKKADGSVKVLSVQSTVEQGDTLVTQKDTYAQIRFTDDSTITLKPDTQFKIDSFSFEPEKKENDSAFFSLIKGGLREVTGLLGKRSKERFGLHTPTATIGIRGTIFIAQLQEAAAESSGGDGSGGGATEAGGAGSIAEGLNPSAAGGVPIGGGGSTTTQPTADPSSGTGADNPSAKLGKVTITIHQPEGSSSLTSGGQNHGASAGAPAGGESTATPPTANPSSGSPPHTAPIVTPSLGTAPMPVTPVPSPGVPIPAPSVSPGSKTSPYLYVQVLEGMINVSNQGGAQNFAAGQFGFVPSVNMPPVILPNNPGLKFSPPPSFSSSTVGQGSNGAPGKEGGVDCVVR